MRTSSLQHGGGLFCNVIVGESALVGKSLALRTIGEAVMAGLFDQGGLLQIVRRVLPLLFLGSLTVTRDSSRVLFAGVWTN